MTRTLFTGAEGFFGNTLLRQGINWIPTCQHVDEARRLSETHGVPVHRMDLANYQQVFEVIRETRPERIVNLGAQSRPDLSWQHPVETVNSNINGTLHILSACHELGLKPIILLASTSAQYGETFEDNSFKSLIDEQAAQKPLNPYGVTKAAAERLAFLLAQYYQLDVRYARIFNTSGYGKLGDVISDFTKRILETNDNRIVVGNLDPLRCFLHINDTIDGLITILEKGTTGESYNICASKEYSVRHILDLVGAAVGKNIDFQVDQSLLRTD